ncbi:MAG: hypothetical protein BWY80_00803 [Firmicutes bacterium ADurb.Bin456]|nr:MAG: hypothetical protein BWY80_00803 [Firmicutes bacterium ADurb.Bin456]
MFSRYATNDGFSRENSYQLASLGQASSLLYKQRAKHLKLLELSGSCHDNVKQIVKVDKDTRSILHQYLCKQKIYPVQTFWDDGSAYYLFTAGELEKIKEILQRWPGQ